MTTVFETEACSRCGGTGRFSHNGEHDRCYKCDGKNGCRSYTKRGAAAKKFYIAKLTIPAEMVKVGDVIKTDYVKQLTVATIEVVKSGAYKNQKTGEWEPIYHYEFANTKGLKTSVQKLDGVNVRLLPNAELNAILIKEALAFQDTLTKAGTVRKTSKKETSNV